MIFVVLDIEEDENVPIILGCQFLNTCDMVIKVRLGRSIHGMRGEQVVFNLSNFVKNLSLFMPVISFRQKIPLML